MAKNKIRDYSATPASNADIEGVGILGTNKLKNIDDFARTIMAHLARMNAGTDPLSDTFAIGDPSDATKSFRFDAGLIPVSTRRIITVPNEDITLPLHSGAPIETIYTTNGTHTFLPSSKYFQVEGVAGGGAGGEAGGNAALNRVAAGGGGSSGVEITSSILPVTTPTGAVVIGAGGENGVTVGGVDGKGGTTSWTGCGFVWTAAGGNPGDNDVATLTVPKWTNGGELPIQTLDSGIKHRAGKNGGCAIALTLTDGFGGVGAASKYGTEAPPTAINASLADAGNPGRSYGGGGGGGISCQQLSGAFGGDGAPGLVIVREW